MGKPDVLYMELDYDDYQRYREESGDRISPENEVQDTGGTPRRTRQLPSSDEAYHQGFAKGREKDGSLAGLPREIPGYDPRYNHGIANVFCKWLSDR